MRIPVENLKVGLQVRLKTDADTVARYSEILREAGEWAVFPPLKAIKQSSGEFVLADGNHRLQAAKLAQIREIEIEVVGSTTEDLFRAALTENLRQGLAMTRADRQNAIKLALRTFPDATLSWIAELCGCTHPTVLKFSRELANEGFQRAEKIKGADGRVRKSTCKNLQVENSETPSQKPQEYVSCSCCGLKVARELLDAPDSTWEKRDFNPETLRYEKFYCSEDCLANANGSEFAVGGVEGDWGINDPSQSANKPVVGDTGAYFRNYEFYQVSFKAPAGIEEIIRKVLEEEVNAIEISLQGNININLNNNINNINTPKKSEFVFPIRRHVIKKGSPAVIETSYELSEEEILEFESTFPNLDVRAELKKCLLWNKLNPKKRKTKSGIKQHLNTWLANAKPGGKKEGFLPNKKYQAAGLDFDSLEY